MHITRKPKLISALFVGGTTLLIGGAAVAASLSPSSARMLHMSDAGGRPTSTSSTSGAAPRSASSAAATTASAKAATPTAKPTTSPTRTPARHSKPTSAPKRSTVKAPITYTVRRGDTLSGIATWFKLHGYGDLYNANAKVIGANPNLIHPGERITIGTHVMTVRGPA